MTESKLGPYAPDIHGPPVPPAPLVTRTRPGDPTTLEELTEMLPNVRGVGFARGEEFERVGPLVWDLGDALLRLVMIAEPGGEAAIGGAHAARIRAEARFVASMVLGGAQVLKLGPRAADKPLYALGDVVRVVGGAHDGRVGSVVYAGLRSGSGRYVYDVLTETADRQPHTVTGIAEEHIAPAITAKPLGGDPKCLADLTELLPNVCGRAPKVKNPERDRVGPLAWDLADALGRLIYVSEPGGEAHVGPTKAARIRAEARYVAGMVLHGAQDLFNPTPQQADEALRIVREAFDAEGLDPTTIASLTVESIREGIRGLVTYAKDATAHAAGLQKSAVRAVAADNAVLQAEVERLNARVDELLADNSRMHNARVEVGVEADAAKAALRAAARELGQMQAGARDLEERIHALEAMVSGNKGDAALEAARKALIGTWVRVRKGFTGAGVRFRVDDVERDLRDPSVIVARTGDARFAIHQLDQVTGP